MQEIWAFLKAAESPCDKHCIDRQQTPDLYGLVALYSVCTWAIGWQTEEANGTRRGGRPGGDRLMN